MNKHLNRGVSIIETVIAVLLLAIIGGAVATLVVQTASANNCAKLRNQAAKYAEESIEQVRDLKQNSSWTSFYGASSDSGTCYPDGDFTGGSISCTSGGQTISGSNGFKRYVRIQRVNGNPSQIKAQATVSISAKCSGRGVVEVGTYFYDY